MLRSLFAPHRDGYWVASAALIVALVSARPYAGGWNDGSRLAAVESLVERETLAITDSVFVRVPRYASPYDPGEPDLIHTGTLDKLFIDGEFYSDKSPVPSLILAGAGKLLQSVGISATAQPSAFCWCLNLIGGGLCYVAAICGIFRLFGVLGLARRGRLALTASLALGTIALPYSRHVNNHIQLLAVIAWLLPLMIEAGRRTTPNLTGVLASFILPGIGLLAGLGYTIDLGIGPVLLASAAGWLLWRCRELPTWRARIVAVALFAVGALPWLVLHHALNFAVAGTIGPANAVPQYLQWFGSPFDTSNMTGRWQHPSVSHFVIYALDMLVGQKGILGHNLPLYLAALTAPLLLRRPLREKPELVFALVFSGLAFLAYAVTSNNYSGRCLSIRWFVPLLAPGYFMLGLSFRARPQLVRFFAPLAISSAGWAALAWLQGPWHAPPLIQFWIITSLGLFACGWIAVRRTDWPALFRQLGKWRRFRIGASISRAECE